jgi:Peptidase propeptide and YPEB domain
LIIEVQSGFETVKTKTILCAVLTGALLVGGLVGCATEKDSQAKLQAQAKISRSEAEKIALAKVPNGTIKEGEIENEKGKLIWSFDIATPGTADISEVQVDAMSGEVVAIEKESPSQQAKEKKKDQD